jgi:hypothetical protein
VLQRDQARLAELRRHDSLGDCAAR